MTHKEPDAQAFAKALEAAGFKVQHYNGRSGFQGPSVTVSDHTELARAIQAAPTKFADILQWDNMGRTGYVLYGPTGQGQED